MPCELLAVGDAPLLCGWDLGLGAGTGGRPRAPARSLPLSNVRSAFGLALQPSGSGALAVCGVGGALELLSAGGRLAGGSWPLDEED